MLFYAATMPAKAADQLQHSSALMVPHAHDGLGGFSVDAVHDDHDHQSAHHDDGADTGEPTDGEMADGHHHHGDAGPNMLVCETPMPSSLLLADDLYGVGKERSITGLRPVGPERPPRRFSLIA